VRTERFTKRTRIPAPAAEVFAWHARPGAFERLNPPWDPVEIVERSGGIAVGARTVIRLGPPLRVRWVAEHTVCDAPHHFRDVARSGPFAYWVHDHRFHAAGDAACDLEDDVEYALPCGALGRWAGGRAVRRRLERVFAYRHRVTAGDLALHRGAAPRRVRIDGAAGPFHAALVAFLSTGGHEVEPTGPADVTLQLADGGVAVTEGARVVRLELGAVVHRVGRRFAPRGPWVTVDDALGAVLHAMRTPSLAGDVPAYAPGGGALAASGFVHRHPTPSDAMRHLRGEPGA